MKKTILSIIYFVAICFSLQGQELWMSYELMPKKGMADQFEAAAAKKTQKFNKTAEDGIFTFKFMDGENQGMYQRVVGWKDWEFFNDFSENDEEQKYWNENVGKFIEKSSGWKVWQRLVDVSHNWTPETTFNHMYVYTRFIKPGQDQAVYNFLQRLKKVYEKNNFTGISGIFRVRSGGNTNEYIIIEGFDKFGEFGKYPDTDKTEEQLYNEMFGWETYRKDARAYNDALESYSRTTERLDFVEKLSTKL